MQTQKIDTYVRNSLEQASRLKHLLEFEDAKLHPGMEPKLLNFACLGLAEEAGTMLFSRMESLRSRYRKIRNTGWKSWAMCYGILQLQQHVEAIRWKICTTTM